MALGGQKEAENHLIKRQKMLKDKNGNMYTFSGVLHMKESRERETDLKPEISF